jgi:hypothetical protein
MIFPPTTVQLPKSNALAAVHNKIQIPVEILEVGRQQKQFIVANEMPRICAPAN